MLNETYRAMLNNKSVIRETFMYGRQRAAQIGSENVFDYSLGNPSVPCPPEFTEAMQTLLAQEEPVSLHGYCPSQGDPGFRTAVAAHLTETFGLPYAQKHIFCALLPGVRPLCGGHRGSPQGGAAAGTHLPAQSGYLCTDADRKGHLRAHQHAQ